MLMRGLGSPLSNIATAVTVAVLAFAAPAATSAAADRSHATEASRSTVLLVRSRSVIAMRFDGPFLTWETSGTEDNPTAGVFERDSRNGHVTRIATNVLADLGMASDRNWVVYGRLVGTKQQLVAASRDNRVRHVLSNKVIAPIDVRGDRVAWVEQAGSRDRIVVNKIGGGARWVAASLPRCARGRCYRIDAVTLADRGVVFDRATIGGTSSQIVRRAYGSARTAAVTLRDPQPDLRPSASGAFYYYVQHGWFKWDFTAARPVRVPLRGGPGQDVAAVLGGRVMLISGARCRQTLTVRMPNGAERSLGGPPAPKVVPTYGGAICRQLTAVDSSAGRILAAWSYLPEADLEAHEESDLVGLVTVERF
jgi:hypothetical protein